MTAIAACRTCGTEPLENARFCHGCGSPVQDGDTRAEYKQVTVLFADVVHSMDIAATVGTERLREIMADLAACCAAVAQATGTAGGAGTQDILSQFVSSLSSALQGLTSPTGLASNPLAGSTIWQSLNSNVFNGLTSAGYVNPATITPAVTSGMSDINSLQTPGNSLQTPGLVPPLMPPGGRYSIPAFAGFVAPGHGPASSPALGGMSAMPSRAALVGRLSVPQSWIAATQVANHAGTALPGGDWTSAGAPAGPSAAAGAPGIPGMPFAVPAGTASATGPDTDSARPSCRDHRPPDSSRADPR